MGSLVASAERVRIFGIVVKDKETAQKVLSAARELDARDDEGFRALAARMSEDGVTKARRGDFGFIDRSATRNLPAAVVDAALKMTEVGAESGVIGTDRGFYILRLAEHEASGLREVGEVRDQIVSRIASEARAKKVEAWSDGVQRKHSVRIFDERLKDVDVTAAN
jgi:parvulin-like peptidyl-prolyl isomerase